MTDSPLKLGPGEPNLALAIVTAGQAVNGARYVYQYDRAGVWYTSEKVPRVPAFFRIVALRVYARTADGHEAYYGRIEGNTVVPEGTPDGIRHIGAKAR